MPEEKKGSRPSEKDSRPKNFRYLVTEPEGISQFYNPNEAMCFYRWKVGIRPNVKVALIKGRILECVNY